MGTGYPRRGRAIRKIGLNNEDRQHGNPDNSPSPPWPLSLQSRLDTSGNEASRSSQVIDRLNEVSVLTLRVRNRSPGRDVRTYAGTDRMASPQPLSRLV